MSGLRTVVSLNLRISRERGPDDYDVRFQELPVGRIMRRLVPDGAPSWFWTIHHLGDRRRLVGESGPAASREEAVAKLQRRWDQVFQSPHSDRRQSW